MVGNEQRVLAAELKRRSDIEFVITLASFLVCVVKGPLWLDKHAPIKTECRNGMRVKVPSHTPYGVVAQLGERLNGIQKVVGSRPIFSTKRFKSLY